MHFTSSGGIAATAASKMRKSAQVAATSSSARWVDVGAPKAFTKSINRCDLMRGNAMRAKSSESIQMLSSSGYPLGWRVVNVRSKSAL